MHGGKDVLLNILFVIYYDMSSSSTGSTDTAYDILKVMGKDAGFLYDTIDTYRSYTNKNISIAVGDALG
jgi:hypothetical protein